MAALTGEPPPSTFAAQIVENIEVDIDKPQQPSSRQHLRTLLHRILDASRSEDFSGDSIENNLVVNHKLIYVIVQATLQQPTLSNPFENQEELHGLAQDGLAVADLTIRRFPDVLTVQVPGSETYLGQIGPLYVWLIPHLFNTIIDGKHEKTRYDAYKALGSLLSVRSKTPAAGGSSQPLMKFIQGCVNDILVCIETSSDVGLRSSNILKERVPSQRTLSSLEDHYLSSAQLNSFFVPRKDVSHNLSLLSQIVAATVNGASPHGFSNKIAPRRRYEWAVGILPRLWYILEHGTNAASNVHFEAFMFNVLSAARVCISHLRNYSVLGFLFADPRAKPLHRQVMPLRNEICWTLFEIMRICHEFPESLQIFTESLGPKMLGFLVEGNPPAHFGEDVQRAYILTLQILENSNFRVTPQLLAFQDQDLSMIFSKYIEEARIALDQHSPTRPLKRARTVQGTDSNLWPSFEENLSQRLPLALKDAMLDDNGRDSWLKSLAAFKGLSQEHQSAMFVSVGEVICSSTTRPLSEQCSICDLGNRTWAEDDYIDQRLSERVFTGLTQLTRQCQEQRASRPRIAAMIALNRFFAHTKDTAHLDLKESGLGQWCVQSLKSSVRDLRIAAVKTLPNLIRDSLDIRILCQNRYYVLDFLRFLSERDDLMLQETCVLALGQIASNVSSEEETEITLLRLVEFLGNSNQLISHLAYEELQKLSAYSPTSAIRLFEPYWRTIAVTAVRDIQKRPQISQLLSDLLGVSVQELLKITQFYTIPFLILTKKKETLQRVASANGKDSSVTSICLEREQLCAILACLLLQQSPDPAALTMSLLVEASPSFATVDLAELLKVDPMQVVYELLKNTTGKDPEKTVRARNAIMFVAEKTQKKTSKRAQARQQPALGTFFDEGSLGIMQVLSDIVCQNRTHYPMPERRRCLKAVQEMADIARSHLSNALPQVCSCLRSAIEEPSLCDDAFSAWMTLLEVLEIDEIENLIDPTFAMVAQYWDSLSTDTQTRAHDAIGELLRTHPSTIRDMVNTIPSLGDIPLLKKFELEIGRLKAQMDPKHQFKAFSKRCRSENVTVVSRALSELNSYLEKDQSYLQSIAVSEQPDQILHEIFRSLLDVCFRFGTSHPDIAAQSAKCLGLVGCPDPSRIEIAEEKKEIFVMFNFTDAEETIGFIIFLIEEVLVKAFLATTDTRSQGLLAFVLQELLRMCGFNPSITLRRDVPDDLFHRWINIQESNRNVLTPFLSSKYVLEPPAPFQPQAFPLFKTGMSHASWLRQFMFDLLSHGVGANASIIFSTCQRVIRRQDVAISAFLLPFAVLNIVLGGDVKQKRIIEAEFLTILMEPLPTTNELREDLIICSNDVFRTIDHLSRWVQEKMKDINNPRNANHRPSQHALQGSAATDIAQIQSVESLLQKIPAEVMSQRAVECRNFARALFYWEQYIRHCKANLSDDSVNRSELYEKLQSIYAEIDEPDGIEGISAHLHVLDIDQQVIEHRKAGRWTAVQSWYEVQLNGKPDDAETRFNLMTCLRESGQYDALLNQIASFGPAKASSSIERPFAVEASWVTSRWNILENFVGDLPETQSGDFDVGVGSMLLSLYKQDIEGFSSKLNRLRQSAVRSLSTSAVTSLQACHDALLKLHALTEIEMISGIGSNGLSDKAQVMRSLAQRLEVLGTLSSDKQYLLGLRRAAMQLSQGYDFQANDQSSAWLTSAMLARKAGFTRQAFNAVLHASKLGDDSATIEHARLLWQDEHHRKAIQTLEGAILSDIFEKNSEMVPKDSAQIAAESSRLNPVASRAHLLLAKWMDRAGQTQSDAIIKQYQRAVDLHNRSEKGHYYLGKHYYKLLESERTKDLPKQAQTSISGEMAKLIISCYLRSLAMGCKYTYQTLPRVLTLWLELGSDVGKPLDPKYGNEISFRNHIDNERKRNFGSVMAQVKKYIDRLPAFVFYTAFAQIVARIGHPNPTVYAALVDIVAKVVTTHPQQALWTLLAMVKSTSVKERAMRGSECMAKVMAMTKKSGSGPDTARVEMQNFLNQGQKLSEQLINVCDGNLGDRMGLISLGKDLRFNHNKCAPCRLVIPLESTLFAALPTVADTVRTHKAFPKETVTIQAFVDEAFVLKSLARPKKVDVRGSDGKMYSLMCKPKDDLRKDQRTLEFNSMIGRMLKKDAACSRRRLYIKTYAVTPLNEFSGLVEWVPGLRTLREIVLDCYSQKGSSPDFGKLRKQMDGVCEDLRHDRDKSDRFTKEILAKLPPVLHEWYMKSFAEPSAWFAARLRYTRSCAVMSMVGYVLGLGDRHGENVLFEERAGGIMHVDFNCLFDKGKTFEKPEMVPFRLTHNMVDAFGPYGYDGPFRKSCELTLGILRQHEHTLMTTLETFVHDPTADFMGKRKRPQQPPAQTSTVAAMTVPETPEAVLESIRNKARGMLPMESVPLSVEGYVHMLISEATDPYNLARMYIGWCPFF